MKKVTAVGLIGVMVLSLGDVEGILHRLLRNRKRL